MTEVAGHYGPNARTRARVEANGFIPVKEIYDGGEGVPQAHYQVTYGGEIITTVYSAVDALGFIAGRGAGWAIIAVVDGVVRGEVARNPGIIRRPV